MCDPKYTSKTLSAWFSEPTPRWEYMLGSNQLRVGDRATPDMTISLSAEQVETLMAMPQRMGYCELYLPLGGKLTGVLLIGRRLDSQCWSGLLAEPSNLGAALCELQQSLAFAEQVITEVSSLVCIVDIDGNIKRFNRRCEEVTGFKESEVIGKSALDMFMPSEQAAVVLKNIRTFFSTLTSWETERIIYGKNGPRLMLWRNQMVRSGLIDEWFLVCSGTDITDEKQAKEDAAKQSQFARDALELSPIPLFIKEPCGPYLYANHAAKELLESPQDDILGKTTAQLLGPETELLFEHYERLSSDLQSYASFEVAFELNGRLRHVLVKSRPLEQPDGRQVVLLSMNDLSSIREAEKALVESETLHRSVVNTISSGIVITDADDRVVAINPAAERMLDLPAASTIGTDFVSCLANWGCPEAVSCISNVIEYSQALTDKVLAIKQSSEIERKWLRYSSSPLIHNGEQEPYGILHSFDDITEAHAAEEKLYRLANLDTLTELPNRYAVQQYIKELIENLKGRPFGVAFIDLDNFKQVNDNFGHAVGDKMIQEAALAIRSALDDRDMLARLGGDEFLIVSPLAATHETLMARCEVILNKLRQPFVLEGTQVYSGCSIGAALYPENGTTLEELISNADTAMYAAKDSGKHAVRFFVPEMLTQIRNNLWLDRNIRTALEENQFYLVYQPKICMATNRVYGVEALVRWYSPEKGHLSPMDFIPYAEKSGLIVPLGRWVLETAAKQARKWRDQGLDLRIAVNISARQLRDASILADFAQTINQNQWAASLLDIELTESWIVEDESTAVRLIEEFRRNGAEVHLDDFGTGLSSLSQLVRLPLDVVKLDRNFVNAIEGDGKARALVRSMTAVAKELGFRVVAEGIETQQQAEFIAETGVDFGQGYYFSRPLPVEDFENWLKNWESPAYLPPASGISSYDFLVTRHELTVPRMLN